MGVGGLAALLPCMVELATIEPGVRADLATQGGSTFTLGEIDRCLDSGGKIDQENKKCVREKNNEYP